MIQSSFGLSIDNIRKVNKLNYSELFTKIGMNTGNIAFTHAINEIIRIDNQFTWGDDISDNTNEILIMPLANQLNNIDSYKNLGKKIIKSKKPVLGIGLGAQAEFNHNINSDIISDDNIFFLNSLKKNSLTDQNIALRGLFTYELLHNRNLHKNTCILGCPSNLLNTNHELGQFIKDKINFLNNNIKVSVSAGNFNISNLSRLENSLFELTIKYNGSYVIQHPIDYIKIIEKNSLDELNNEKINKFFNNINTPILENNKSKALEYFFKKSKLFFDIFEWMSHLKDMSLHIGTRIHGSILAIQAGVPSLCLTIDHRTEELCNFMNIPNIRATNFINGISLYEIINILKNWDWVEYDNRRKYQSILFKYFFDKNNIVMNSKYLGLINDI